MTNHNYTCNHYREEMILLGLRQRLTRDQLTESEREEIQKEIKKIEIQMGLSD